MKLPCRLFCAGLAILFSGASELAAFTARRPFPQHTVYAGEHIRPQRRTQAQQDADVVAAYASWKARYLLPAGTDSAGHPLYRVSLGVTDPGSTVSEGQGYGMMIVAIMAGHDPDAQALFDGLWRFALAHPSSIDPRLMDYLVPGTEGNDSAFDGDCDIAFSLLLAYGQWGSGGEIDYLQRGIEQITAVLESTIGAESRLPLLGDWVGQASGPYNQYTPRSSDFMLDHFRAFERARRHVPGNNVWTTVVSMCHGVAGDLITHFRGLLPDFIELRYAPETVDAYPAPAGFLEGPYDGDYYYNAVRVPWRFGTDVLINPDNGVSYQTRAVSHWARTAASGNPLNIKPGYHLNGTPIPPADYFTALFPATFMVAAMTAPDQQQWLDDLYDVVRVAREDYYEDSVALLCLIVATGNWWDPTVAAPSAGVVAFRETNPRTGARSYRVAESAGTVVIEVERRGESSSPASVRYWPSPGTAVVETDYIYASGVVHFAAGETTKSFSVTLVDDNLAEPVESFTVYLGAPAWATLDAAGSTATVRIENDDARRPSRR